MRVHLSHYPHGGVKTEVNGTELPEVVDIHLRCPTEGLSRLNVTMNATELDVTLDATVTLTFQTFPGHEVNIERLPDGRQRVKAVKQ